MPYTQDAVMLVAPHFNFSEKLCRHAMYLARTHHWNLIALSVGDELSRVAKADLPGYCAEFVDASRKNASHIAEAARVAGVDFTHMVRFGETEKTVKAVCDEYGNVSCVLFDYQKDFEMRMA